MNNELKYQRYAQIAVQIAQLEEEKKALGQELLSDLIEKGGKIEMPYGKFTTRSTKTWTYPQNVIELEEKFKIAKTDAQESGAATAVESKSFVFTAAKL